ncbi:insulin-like peptide receptor isoform X2 [Branchiostoma lanceolatum]|uniref:insulin-like peptide receptor isoform X2 n=1 Tax=Branchiostoma lanceolatum TaxID=7740 RepID=UPI003452BD97
MRVVDKMAGLMWAALTLVIGLGLLVPSNGEEHICGSMDIRNRVSNLRQLDNCTVIEGYLQILLIDFAEEQEYRGLSFPDLVEITDYFLLYRVRGLTNLSELFPNLAVIRGTNLFFNYALVVFEMLDMQKIGLYSLQNITRGSVRIEKNPNLCYLDTIDWSFIAESGYSNNFIVDNRDEEECVNYCPGSCRITHPVLQDLCWAEEHCQKVCPESCLGNCLHGCTTRSSCTCCNEMCIGGCRGGTSRRHCVACKYFVHNGECLEQCPTDTYQYKDRRCITADECPNSTNSIWKLHHGKCIPECPSGYTTDPDNPRLCTECEGQCPKSCKGGLVDSLAAAQRFRGCTIIEEELKISIRGGDNIIDELEDNLGLIEEVGHYVAIVRSYALVTLDFLRSLKRIRGIEKENGYAFYVLDNRNLEKLLDWDRTNLTMDDGKLFFHFNPKLCMNVILTMVEKVGVSEDTVSDTDISTLTNGDQAQCSYSKLDINEISTTKNMIILRWRAFTPPDFRDLLSYTVSYRETPEQSIDEYEGQDACGNTEWKDFDVSPDQTAHIITGLKPWTQYALLVKTYTKAGAREGSGAKSDIVYARTDADKPTHPLDVVVYSNSSNTLIITWNPPNRPNGNVTHYIVKYKRQQEDVSAMENRDYCQGGLKPHRPTQGLEDIVNNEEENNNSTTGDGTCCECPKSEDEIRIEEEEAAFQQEFENFLHNNVYHKRENDTRAGRRRRELLRRATISPFYSNQTVNVTLPSTNRTVPPTPTPNPNPQLETTVWNEHMVVLTGLRHFSEYIIEVIACNADEAVGCSGSAVELARTQADDSADNIPGNITVMETKDNKAKLYWPEPYDPNSMVVLYNIEYKKLGVDGNYEDPQQICVENFRILEQQGFTISSLAAGNYSVRVQATSFAGNGSWSNYVTFYVEEKDTPPGQDTPPQVPLSLMIGMGVGFSLLVILAVIFAFWYCAKKKFGDKQMPNGVLYASVNPEYMSSADVYVPDEWEVPREKITLIRELGQGSFGMVYEGEAKDVVKDEPKVSVAVKTVNESASIRERIEFLNEASVMKTFNCHHVVKLVGVVSKGQPTLVVMELMALGDLKNYLRRHRPEEDAGLSDSPASNEAKNSPFAENDHDLPPTFKDIIQMAGEIADGMSYLAAKKFVHRDLACRNCMVAQDRTVKIGDFGMTRDIYETDYYRKGGKGLLPVRWMSPESLKDGVFTSQSDVWSYGVVLWEMATLASQPYQGKSNEEVLKFVIDGGMLEKPEGCPNKLYDLMKLCWQYRQSMRPTFLEIVEILSPELQPHFPEVSFYHSLDNHGREPLEMDEVALDSGADTETEMYPSGSEFSSTPSPPSETPYSHMNGSHPQNGSMNLRIPKSTLC